MFCAYKSSFFFLRLAKPPLSQKIEEKDEFVSSRKVRDDSYTHRVISFSESQRLSENEITLCKLLQPCANSRDRDMLYVEEFLVQVDQVKEWLKSSTVDLL